MRTAVGGELGVLRAHVRIAHQYDRPVAPLPGEHLEAVLVVGVVRALALRHVAPAAGDVAGRVDVFEEVQRERLVEQRGARERAPLLGRQLLVGESARLLQRAEVIPGVDADRVERRPGPQCQHCVRERVEIGVGAREQEVGEVGVRPRRILRVGALQSGVGGAQRVQALGATRLVGEAPLCVADDAGRCASDCSGVAVTGMRARSSLSCAATSATARIQSDRRTVSSMPAAEQA